MTFHGLIILSGILVQLLFAWFTAEDARKRGEGRWRWFCAVLIFGVLAVLLYLLIRSDNQIPESERTERISLPRTPLIYIGAVIAGLVISGLIGATLAPLIYPIPYCDSDTRTTESGEFEYYCANDVSHEFHQKQFERQNKFIGLAYWAGAITFPGMIFLRRKYIE